MLLTILILFVLVVLYHFGIQYYLNYKWDKKPLHNFPFLYRGKEYWYSRSVAVTHFVFCKNLNNEWCILANERGSGTPDYQGYWNCPCGYLDFNENGEEAAQRETFEETGLYLKKENINFWRVSTSPLNNRQNVSIFYYSVLDGNCEDFKLSNKGSEKDEVSNIKWIPINNTSDYDWAFNHPSLIREIYNSVITNN